MFKDVFPNNLNLILLVYHKYFLILIFLDDILVTLFSLSVLDSTYRDKIITLDTDTNNKFVNTVLNGNTVVLEIPCIG